MSYLYLDEQDKSRLKQFARTDARSVLDLFSHIANFKKYFVIYFVSIIVSTFFLIMADRLMGLVIDEGILLKNYHQILSVSGWLLFSIALGIIIEWRAEVFFHKCSSFIILEIRKKIFNKLLALPRSYYDHTPNGRIVVRMTHDVENIESFFTKTLSTVLIGMIHLIASVSFMIFLHVKLGLIILVSVVPGIIFFANIKSRLRDIFRVISRLSSAMNAKVAEYIDGMEIIRGYGLEDWTKDSYDLLNDDYLKATLKSNTIFALVRPITSFLISMPLLVLLYFGGRAVMGNTLSVGIFVTYIGLTMRFVRPCLNIANELQQLQEVFTNSERIMAFLSEDEEEDLFISTNKLQIDLRGNIEFKDLYFRYEENDDDVLKNINLTIYQGEKVAIVGRTGSGKTSLISLLMRLYEYRNGEILINNTSLHQIDRNYLRTQIGHVSQQVFLFPDTVRNNIVLGRKIDEDHFKKLCESSGMNSLMKTNHWNLDTKISASGTNFALGEKHLICILRELVTAPPILILDEATASLDYSFEDTIYRALAELAKDTTIITVAHRPETFNKCDRIIRIASGKIKI